jgi:hypothetical protein
VLSNSFAAGVEPPSFGGVSIQGGTSRAVSGNSFTGFTAPAATVSGVPPGKSHVEGNYEF